MKRRILLVDDELAILLTLKTILEIHGFDVETAASAKEALAKLKANSYHMVITDMKMEHDRAGYDVIRSAKKTDYDPAVAILTAHPLLGGDWKSEGVQSMLVKPMNTNDLLRQIEVLLIQHEDKHRQSQRPAGRGANARNGRTQAVRKPA
ncbi:MAG TPA: response regulator [Candidatus Angelobacter sp.]|nr:response regulator [Candidatus Angelobacter sp.]